MSTNATSYISPPMNRKKSCPPAQRLLVPSPHPQNVIYSTEYTNQPPESGKSLNDLNASSFPLPLLADQLAATRETLHNGVGLAVLRGLDISALSMREVFATFAGLASHVAQRRGRQSGGKMVGKTVTRMHLTYVRSHACLQSLAVGLADRGGLSIVHITDLSELGGALPPAPYRNSTLVSSETLPEPCA